MPKTSDTRRPCKVGVTIFHNPLPIHLVFWGLWKIVAYSQSYIAGLLVSIVLDTVSSPHHSSDFYRYSTCLVSGCLFMYAVKTPKLPPITPMTAPMTANTTPTTMGVIVLELLVDKVCLLPTENSVSHQ